MHRSHCTPAGRSGLRQDTRSTVKKRENTSNPSHYSPRACTAPARAAAKPAGAHTGSAAAVVRAPAHELRRSRPTPETKATQAVEASGQGPGGSIVRGRRRERARCRGALARRAAIDRGAYARAAVTRPRARVALHRIRPVSPGHGCGSMYELPCRGTVPSVHGKHPTGRLLT